VNAGTTDSESWYAGSVSRRVRPKPASGARHKSAPGDSDIERIRQLSPAEIGLARRLAEAGRTLRGGA
jgi:hypothetical protein